MITVDIYYSTVLNRMVAVEWDHVQERMYTLRRRQHDYALGKKPPNFPVPACYSPQTIFAAYHALALMKTFFDTRVYYGAKNYPL